MRLLFLASRFPFPPIGGDKLRVARFVDHLAERHEVTLLAFVESRDEAEAAAAAPTRARVRTVVLPRPASWARAARGLAASGLPLQVHYYRDARMARAVEGELRAGGYDAALAHMVRMAGYLLDGAPVEVPVVVDLQDSLSMNYARAGREAEIGWWRPIYLVEGPRVARYEEAVARRAHAALLVTDVDLDDLRRRAPDARLEVVTNGVDLERFPFRPGGSQGGGIVLLGNMRTAANQDMAVHFARDVFPRVLAIRPEARFHIVGTQPSRAVRRLGRLGRAQLVPDVPDVAPLLHGASVSVCPMRIGAGLQNKVLESMAAGVPVVATSMGMEGIPAVPGRHALVADQPDAFARAVARLMEDAELRRALAVEARRLVEERFDWGPNLAALDGVLEDVVRRARGGRAPGAEAAS